MGKVRRLSKQQEVFIQELIKGSTQRQAYLKAYPNKKSWKEKSLDAEAHKLFQRPDVKQRYEVVLEQMRAKESEKGLWTREESIRTLRGVIDRNNAELDRINQAVEDELTEIAQAIVENPEKARQLTLAMIHKRQMRRISGVHNGGIVAAAAELNKMSGFNEETINMNGMVVFSGDDQLEE